jgi:hypothetical protein
MSSAKVELRGRLACSLVAVSSGTLPFARPHPSAPPPTARGANLHLPPSPSRVENPLHQLALLVMIMTQAPSGQGESFRQMRGLEEEGEGTT